MEATSAHIAQDQSEIAAFMGRPSTYGVDTRVDRIDTHAAMVFLVGDRAYKIKRAVRFPYMDFSTVERRHRFCECEVVLNRRTAPKLYRGVVPITRQPDGALALDGKGVIIDWVIVMWRFAQNGLLDRIAAAGDLTEQMIRDAADAAANFHKSAEVLSGQAAAGGGRDGMRWVIDENFEEIRESPDLFPASELSDLADATFAFLTRCGRLLDRRLDQGLVRRCHGDLHLRNICLIDGAPTIFDGIEFDDRLSCIDVMYDFAFLLMDLEYRGLRSLGNLALNRYLERFQRVDGLTALPLFLSARACVRAKVAASAAASQLDADACARKQEEAKRYFELARELIRPEPARLIVVGGLSGTGKTSIARRLAPLFGAVPGALHLRSDVLRKTLAGVDELTRLPQSAYSRAMTTKVYATLAEQAAEALAAGHSVIVDAVYLKAAERAAIEAVARQSHAPFDAVWLDASPEVLLQRVGDRTADASDANAGVVRMQLEVPPGDISWRRLDANKPLETLVDEAASLLQCRGVRESTQ